MPVHLFKPTPVLFTATCRVVEPNYRIVKTQFDIDPEHEDFGEYLVMNLMRERGVLQDGIRYQCSFMPLFRR